MLFCLNMVKKTIHILDPLPTPGYYRHPRQSNYKRKQELISANFNIATKSTFPALDVDISKWPLMIPYGKTQSHERYVMNTIIIIKCWFCQTLTLNFYSNVSGLYVLQFMRLWTGDRILYDRFCRVSQFLISVCSPIHACVLYIHTDSIYIYICLQIIMLICSLLNVQESCIARTRFLIDMLKFEENECVENIPTAVREIVDSIRVHWR